MSRHTFTGPLHVSTENPRYFADADNRIVYLTGCHTWSNFKDMGRSDPPAAFDYPAYLDFLARHNHNFIRLWTWDLTKYTDREGVIQTYCNHFPWRRTGPENALDGKPKFDFTQFDQSYFDRLRQRVEAAAERGMYVSIMLFEGWGVQFCEAPWKWDGHPFNPANNINGIDGDPGGPGVGVYTLKTPGVTRIQEAYIRKVIDTVNDLDNVLYEISNENNVVTTDWQYHLIRFIKEYEATKPKQHPVGMTYQQEGGVNQTLFDSPADWISPYFETTEGYDYRDNPPPADGSKVIISDTDHLWGIGGDQTWVWKSFCRGLNPIFMDPYFYDFDLLTNSIPQMDPKWDPARINLGYTRRYAERMNLTQVKPSEELSSTGYCLANPGREYLVYLPEGGEADVDLSAVSGELAVEWFNPSDGMTVTGGSITGGGTQHLISPFPGDAVVYLHK